MAQFRALCEEYVEKLSSSVHTLQHIGQMLESSSGSDQEKKTCLDVALRRALLKKVTAYLFGIT